MTETFKHKTSFWGNFCRGGGVEMQIQGEKRML